jgi:hypothetical protein
MRVRQPKRLFRLLPAAFDRLRDLLVLSAIFVKPFFRKLLARDRCHSADSSLGFSGLSSVEIGCPPEKVAREPAERGEKCLGLADGAMAPRQGNATRVPSSFRDALGKFRHLDRTTSR